jgi:hypothetical protein
MAEINQVPESQFELKELFYPHYLELEKNRREQAVKLFEEKFYDVIRVNFVHYLNSVTKPIILYDGGIEISDLIAELNGIKAQIVNGNFSEVVSLSEEDERITISLTEYSLEGEEKCSSLARCWASDAAFKLKIQPTGTDGLRAYHLYRKIKGLV